MIVLEHEPDEHGDEGLAFAIAIDCLTYAACFAKWMPNVSGFVSWPYSVTQIGTDVRLKSCFRFACRVGSEPSVTFGQRTFCDGLRFGVNGYGWCEYALNSAWLALRPPR